MFTKTRAAQCWPQVLNVLWQSLNVSMKSPHQLSLLWVEKPGKHPTNLLDKTQLTCLTGLAGTWPSLWLFSLAFPSFPPPFPPALASCHCFATAWSHSASSLQGVVKELTATRYTTPAFIFGLFPLFSAKRAKLVCIFAQLTRVRAQLGSLPCTPGCKQPCWCSNLAKGKIKWAQIPQTLWGWYFNDILLRLNQKTLTTVTVRRLYSEHRSVKMRMTVEFLTDLCTFSFSCRQ